MTEVAMPADIARLEGVEFYRRLLREFHLPRGQKQFARKAARR
ncbi:MAG: hypothetical protein U0361_04545 [Nitrospiraceae bacterium]